MVVFLVISEVFWTFQLLDPILAHQTAKFKLSGQFCFTRHPWGSWGCQSSGMKPKSADPVTVSVGLTMTLYRKKKMHAQMANKNLEWNLNSSSIVDAKIIRSFYFNEENEQFCKDCPISMINWWGLALMLTNFDIDICKDRENTIAWEPCKKKARILFFSSNFCPLLRLIWVLFISDNLFMGDEKIIFYILLKYFFLSHLKFLRRPQNYIDISNVQCLKLFLSFNGQKIGNTIYDVTISFPFFQITKLFSSQKMFHNILPSQLSLAKRISRFYFHFISL